MKKLQTVIDRQIAWQSHMKSDLNTMYLAWVAEVGELVDSMGFADWKSHPRDEANMLVEAVDILIFTINIVYYEEHILDFTTAEGVESKNEANMVYFLNYFMSKGEYENIMLLLVKEFPDALDMLVAKQALNALRQDYGYKTGEYIKAWPKGEDNVYLEGLLGEDFDTVYAKLEDIYTNVVVASRLIMD